jgi:hypothetical protein
MADDWTARIQFDGRLAVPTNEGDLFGLKSNRMGRNRDSHKRLSHKTKQKRKEEWKS